MEEAAATAMPVAQNYIATKTINILLPPSTDKDEWDGKLGLQFNSLNNRNILFSFIDKNNIFDNIDLSIGDELLEIDGKSVHQLNNVEAMEMIRKRVGPVYQDYKQCLGKKQIPISRYLNLTFRTSSSTQNQVLDTLREVSNTIDAIEEHRHILYMKSFLLFKKLYQYHLCVDKSGNPVKLQHHQYYDSGVLKDHYFALDCQKQYNGKSLHNKFFDTVNNIRGQNAIDLNDKKASTVYVYYNRLIQCYKQYLEDDEIVENKSWKHFTNPNIYQTYIDKRYGYKTMKKKQNNKKNSSLKSSKSVESVNSSCTAPDCFEAHLSIVSDQSSVSSQSVNSHVSDIQEQVMEGNEWNDNNMTTVGIETVNVQYPPKQSYNWDGLLHIHLEQKKHGNKLVVVVKKIDKEIYEGSFVED